MITEKITSVSSMPSKVIRRPRAGEAEQAAVRELVKAARARGEDLEALGCVVAPDLEDLDPLTPRPAHLGVLDPHPHRSWEDPLYGAKVELGTAARVGDRWGQAA